MWVILFDFEGHGFAAVCGSNSRSWIIGGHPFYWFASRFQICFVQRIYINTFINVYKEVLL